MSEVYIAIQLSQSEVIMLKAALSLMKDHCDKQIAANVGAPFFSHRMSVKSVQEKISESTYEAYTEFGRRFLYKPFEKPE